MRERIERERERAEERAEERRRQKRTEERELLDRVEEERKR